MPEHVVVLGANQRREVTHGAQVGLDLPAFALADGLLDLQVGEGSRP
jgi:hypothetical protein